MELFLSTWCHICYLSGIGQSQIYSILLYDPFLKKIKIAFVIFLAFVLLALLLFSQLLIVVWGMIHMILEKLL